jgi:hypothetical protein
MKTKLKAGYAAKTDRLDARRLADALRRDSVVGIYYPSLAIRELRELCRYRHALVQVRTALINRLRAVLLRQGVVDRRRLARTRSDAWLEALTLPPRAAAGLAGLRRLLTIVRTEVAQADREVLTLAAADPIAQRLQEIPGLGPVLSLMIRAEIGDLQRFPTPGHLASYAGLVPRGQQCTPRAVWPHYPPRLAVVALGARRSRHPWHAAHGSHRAVGSRAGRPQRGPKGPGRARAHAVRRRVSTLADRMTSSPERCRRTET